MSVLGRPDDHSNLRLSKFGVVLAQDFECLLRIPSLPILETPRGLYSIGRLRKPASMRIDCRSGRTCRFCRALIAFGYALPRRHLIHRSVNGREGWHVNVTSADWRRSRREREDGEKGQAQTKERLQTQKRFAAGAKTEN